MPGIILPLRVRAPTVGVVIGSKLVLGGGAGFILLGGGGFVLLGS